MISVFRAPDKTTGKLAPLVLIALGAEDVILTVDTETPTSCVGLAPADARKIANLILALAEEIDQETAAESQDRT